ncbi:hypothetical protein EOI86_14615 [Hwanghaeella grinnelliae]|uniref:Uncharacterized protein n=1 Tax=Hwanghaeella grinnelliae TaxID=2500179 RepID=A0A3S2W4P8_9PROT|nr:hypothetical protein [Hwanghaeella grinnelliae]RVU36433.1 hypothetical protein EOI86_14615 [Hwanghaeella grinnelliae]
MTGTGRGQGSTLLPSDFSQRGVAVPFTTRLLFFTRMRHGADGAIEFLVPGLAGGLKTCVIPQGKIGATLSMTVFDRALMEELSELSAITPATVEQASLAVGMTALGGSRLLRRARERREADKRATIALEGLLVNDLLTALGAERVDFEKLNLEDLRARAAAALEPHAATLESPIDAILSRIRQWAHVILPLGSPALELPGPYTTTMADMERFAAELMDWLIPEPVGPAEMAQRIAVAARKTASTAKERVARAAEYQAAILDSIKNWDTTWAALTNEVETVSNILDGWQRLIEKWDATSRLERVDQRELVGLFALYLPILPRKSADRNQDFWNSIRENQDRWKDIVTATEMMATDQDIREKVGRFKVEPA